MHIIVDLEGYYDWEPQAEGEPAPTEADVIALLFKPGQNGKWLKKVTKAQDTHTEIRLPEAEIQDCLAHFARVGTPKTRAKLVAWYLDEKIMPHHASTEHIVDVHVEGEPEVEAFLRSYFGCASRSA